MLKLSAAETTAELVDVSNVNHKEVNIEAGFSIQPTLMNPVCLEKLEVRSDLSE